MEEKAGDVSILNYMEELLIASGQGLQALTDALAKILRLPILISTSGYNLISSSLSCPDLDSFHTDIVSARIDNETSFFCKLSAGTFHSNAWGRAIAPAGRVIGYIFIFVDDADSNAIMEAHKLIIKAAASLCAVHLQSRVELLKEQQKHQESFLYDLLYGNLKTEEEIVASGATWGWNFTLPHTAIILTIPELDIHSPDKHLMDILNHFTEKALIDRYYKKLPTLIRHNELIVLLPSEEWKQPAQKKEILALMDILLAQLTATELKNRVICGVGQTYVKATNLFRSYQEAKVSLELGTVMGIAVPFFSDIGVERIFYKHDLEDLKEYYAHVLGELHKQDDEELSLISVLESFAENQFEVTKTAEALFLHRNTLRYRLNKIETILGRSLNDHNTRFDIMAALKIKRLHKMDEEL
ncbi:MULTISPECIES: CdaR family transcriptional regulator [Desulfitobacterium]|uniref:Sugar diacid utilization regulator n=1 Tax=Desulfitobacterium dehalogenans (strain ATCC 51507 / DSM 9161 / JW/IU-DC1) TaxID=756499 RepID=I4A8I2_DESDJ|nr:MULTISPECIES: helix-turn-helix domain-containing protein [Desulfitobacterium]AFM00267.1 sugar diacid utilization regulator [Desulfitobacterium dehalogenans ATCC 51507]